MEQIKTIFNYVFQFEKDDNYDELDEQIIDFNDKLYNPSICVDLTEYIAGNCPICLEDGVLYQLNCKHGFHMNCIDKWINKKNNCPLCRKKTH